MRGTRSIAKQTMPPASSASASPGSFCGCTKQASTVPGRMAPTRPTEDGATASTMSASATAVPASGQRSMSA